MQDCYSSVSSLLQELLQRWHGETKQKNSHICKASLIHYYYQATISCPTDEQVQSLINNAFLVSGGSKKTAREPKKKEPLSSEMTRGLERERARDLEEKKKKRVWEEEIKPKRRKRVDPRLQQRS